MTYTTTKQLTVTVKNDQYRAEFDGQEVYVFDKDQHITFSGSMEEAVDIASILQQLHKESENTKIITEENI